MFSTTNERPAAISEFSYLVNLDNHQSYGNMTSLWATGLGVVMLAMVLFVLPRPTGTTGAPSKAANAVLNIATAVVVIALGARLIGPEMAKACVDTFLSTPFGGGRHQRRVDKLSHPHFVKEPA